jgi:hypothetical protein
MIGDRRIVDANAAAICGAEYFSMNSGRCRNLSQVKKRPRGAIRACPN